MKQTSEQTNTADGKGAPVLVAAHAQLLKIPILASTIDHFTIHDVDVIVVLKSGEQIVLAGAGIEAFDSAAPLQVQFDQATPALLKDLLLHSVGSVSMVDTAIVVPSTDKVDATAPAAACAADGQNDSQAAMASAAPAASAAIGDLLSKGAADKTGDAPVTLLKPSFPPPEPTIMPAHSGVSSSKASATASSTTPSTSSSTSDSPVVVGNLALNLSVLAPTNTTQSGSTLYGPFGGTNANVDSSASVQVESASITETTGHMTIIANSGASATFTKFLHVDLLGAGTPQTLTISHLPSDWSIPGATQNADGSYAINLAQYASALGANSYDIPVTYPLVAADPSNPVHSSNQVIFTMGVLQNNQSVSVEWVQTIVVKDVAQASDASYTDPHTGEAALVLPAQGIAYHITGGGSDTIVGGMLNDTIESGVGSNVIDGAGGTNTLSYTNAAYSETVDLSKGTASNAAGTDSITNVQIVIGSNHGDSMVAGAGTLELIGGSGNDTFSPGTANGTVTIDGGGGYNTLDLSGVAGAVSVDLSAGTVSGGTSLSVSNVEHVIGSNYADTLRADNLGDWLQAGNGNASLLGGTGNDLLQGGAGNVTFSGGGGNDTIIGGSGDNTLTFAADTAGAVQVNLQAGTVTGAYGNETVSGIQHVIGSSVGGDQLTGTTGTQSLTGLAGNDTFDGGGASGITIAGAGINNTLTFANDTAGAVQVNLQAGTVTGGYGTETVSGIQRVIGSSVGGDQLTGTTGTQSLTGLAGNDTFDGGGASGITIAGAGINNTLTFANDTAGAVQVNLQAGTVTGGYGTETVSGIQNVVGSAYADSIVAANMAGTIDGGGGNDTIVGSTSAATTLTFAPASGAVSVNLTQGTASGAYGNEQFTNIRGVIGSNYNDTVIGGVSNGTLDGGAGVNTLSFSGTTSSVNVNLVAGTVSGAFGNETVSHFQNVIGSSAADSIVAAAGATTVDGGGGNDTIVGNAAGTTTLTLANATGAMTVNLTQGTTSGAYGSEQFSNIKSVIASNYNDTFIGGVAGGTVDGGAGTNTLSFSGTTSAVSVNLTTGTASGAFGSEMVAHFQKLIGSSAGGDLLVGSTTTTSITGLAGNDTFDGGGASGITIAGAGSNNTLTFASDAAGAVQVNLAAGTVTGSYGTETVSGIQKVIGSSHGGDLLTGTGGTLSLTGLAGSDTFDGGGASGITITGAGSNNMLTFAHDTSGAVNVNLSTGKVTGGYGTETISGIQNVIGSGLGDTIIGSNSGNNINAGTGAGHTSIVGGSGSDMISASGISGGGTINSGAGNDSITAGSGTWNVTFGHGNDTVSATSISGGAIIGDSTRTSTDTSTISVGSSMISAMQSNSSANHIDGGAGVNTVQLSGITSSSTSPFSLSSLSPALAHIGTLDLSKSASTNAYTITSADINAMTGVSSGGALTIKTGGASVTIASLAGEAAPQVSVVNSQVVESIYNSAHTTLIAKLILA